MTDKKKDLFISFSGGKTSAYMAFLILNNVEFLSKFERVFVVFANTGQEHNETLNFVNRCDVEFGFNVVWVEAIVHHDRRVGCTHKVVDFESASREGQPYEEVVKKYGLPNLSYPHCNRELKINPMHSFLAEVSGNGRYSTAVGLRLDEFDRVAKDYKSRSIIYPLIDWGVKKRDVLSFWSKQSFSLKIPDHQGNCVWCFKKSFHKLGKVMTETPDVFDFPLRLERKYSEIKEGKRAIFRGHNSTEDLQRLHKSNDKIFNSKESFSCGETCEMFADDL